MNNLYTILNIVILLITIRHMSVAVGVHCLKARDECVAKFGCGSVLKNFILRCNHGAKDDCSAECKHILASLLSVDRELGEAVIKCDCAQGDSFCQSKRDQLDSCATDVFAAMKAMDDDDAILNCSLARRICEVDTPCKTALDYYYENCRLLSVNDGTTVCGDRCNRSAMRLYRQRKATKLRTCRCDDSNNDRTHETCVVLKENTEKLCFHKTSISHTTNGNNNVGKLFSPVTVIAMILSLAILAQYL